MIASTPAALSHRGLSGRHVLGIFLLFFGVIFAVNGYFLYSALRTHTGVVSVEPYRKGLAYNERIAADERQGRLGWSADFSVSNQGKARLILRDATGSAVTGHRITASIGRPATERLDRNLEMIEAAPGDYTASTAALQSGAWIGVVEVRAATGSDPVYRLRRRLWLTQ